LNYLKVMGSQRFIKSGNYFYVLATSDALSLSKCHNPDPVSKRSGLWQDFL